MKVIRIVSTLVLALLISSCGNLRIKAYQAYLPGSEVKNVALTGFYMAPPKLPEVPATDAKAFNEKVFTLSKKINERLQSNSDRYYQTLAQGLEMQLGVNVIYGEEMESRARYDRLKQKEEREGLKIAKQPNFPNLILAEGSLHLFEVENGDLEAYINDNPRMRAELRGASKGLESEVVAFAYARPVIDRVTTFGEKANLRLLVDVYLYDDRGELVGHTYGETKPVTIDGKAISDYDQVFNLYAGLKAEMLTALTLVEEEEEEDE